jgi:hypothetical protein
VRGPILAIALILSTNPDGHARLAGKFETFSLSRCEGGRCKAEEAGKY